MTFEIKTLNLSYKLAVILLFGIFWGCEKESPSNENVIEKVPIIIPNGTEAYLNQNSDYIFNQQTLHTFELKLPDSALATLDADPTAETYVAGTLIFQGDTISPVGIRYKGSVGAFVGCLSGTDFTNPSGYKTCSKLSMKVKINWEEREERFFGLNKLQFHAQNLDASKMHERLGYWLFRQMGVPAPRSVHARLLINGKFSGLYALTEQIDSRFIKENFDDDDGNLYKEIWPVYASGEVPSEQAFINALKTNEEEFPSANLIRSFGAAIANATDEERQTIIENYMNVSQTIAYAVVDRAIRNDDGAFHWYCDDLNAASCSNHNYYWYEQPVNQKLNLIPWDLDNAFSNIIFNQNPVTPIADDWGMTTNNCTPFPYGAWSIPQWSAACDPLTKGWATYYDLYEQLKSNFKNGPFAENTVNTLIDEWATQIENAMLEETATFNDVTSPEEWNSAINYLKVQLDHARSQ